MAVMGPNFILNQFTASCCFLGLKTNSSHSITQPHFSIIILFLMRLSSSSFCFPFPPQTPLHNRLVPTFFVYLSDSCGKIWSSLIINFQALIRLKKCWRNDELLLKMGMTYTTPCWLISGYCLNSATLSDRAAPDADLWHPFNQPLHKLHLLSAMKTYAIRLQDDGNRKRGKCRKIASNFNFQRKSLETLEKLFNNNRNWKHISHPFIYVDNRMPLRSTCGRCCWREFTASTWKFATAAVSAAYPNGAGKRLS